MNMMLKIGDFVGFLDCAGEPLTMPVPERWYLLRVHPNKEFVVARGIDRRGFVSYLPQYRANLPYGPRRSDGRRKTRSVERPVFPGVVFIPDFDANLDVLKLTDGIINFLKFGDVTAYVSRRLMSEVRKFEAFMNLPAAERRPFKVGDAVKVHVRDLGLWVGKVDRLDANGRLTVLVDAIKREIAVSTTEDQVEPA